MKALRLCDSRFPDLRIACVGDSITHGYVCIPMQEARTSLPARFIPPCSGNTLRAAIYESAKVFACFQFIKFESDVSQKMLPSPPCSGVLVSRLCPEGTGSRTNLWVGRIVLNPPSRVKFPRLGRAIPGDCESGTETHVVGDLFIA